MNPAGDLPEADPFPAGEIAPDAIPENPAADTLGDPVAEQSFCVQLLQGFSGRIDPPRMSFLYQFSLLLVTGFMLLLPVLYLGLIAAAGYGVGWYARHAIWVFGGHIRSVYVLIFQLVIYLGPIIAGSVVVLFMFKPLFASRGKQAQPLAINPGAEPVLFAFISKICDLVRAPMPSLIELSSTANAAASLRRGLFSRELTLTIGLPLVAGLTVNQLAGVVAHEFGHFTQGIGMRLTYIIRSINSWFARVVYERDAADEWLDALTGAGDSLALFTVVTMVHIAVWFSRTILHGLMIAGHFVSCYALRQMEYGADEFEINLAGSATYESTARRIQTLTVAEQNGRKYLPKMWQSRQQLPDDLAAYILKADAALPPETRIKLEDQAGLEPTHWYDTHPSLADRIRRARQLAKPGVFHLEWPSTSLFQNFEALSRQVTIIFYRDEVGLPIEESQLVSVHAPAKPAEPVPEELPAAPPSDPANPPRIRLRIPNR